MVEGKHTTVLNGQHQITRAVVRQELHATCDRVCLWLSVLSYMFLRESSYYCVATDGINIIRLRLNGVWKPSVLLVISLLGNTTAVKLGLGLFTPQISDMM